MNDKLKEKLKNTLIILEVPHEGHEKPNALQNPDLEPMPPSRRVWGFWSFFGYWGVPNITIWTWSTGSAMMALGLSIGHIMGALTLGNIIICIYTCLNSGPGSKYHIGYTVCQRIIFGVYGSGIGIMIRIILSIVFYGSQSWLGGLGMVVLYSSLSENFLNLKDTLPENLAMTTRDFLGFLSFQILQLFFYFMRPERMNKYVNFSCFITIVAFIGVFVTCLAKNGGPGEIYYEKVEMSKMRIGWMWLYSMTIWYGALSPDITNQSDFSRFASSKKKMYTGIISSIMVTGTIVPLFGLICASATKDLYGTEMWLPTDIVLEWLHSDYSPGLRAASFFLGFAFAASQLSFNVLANGFAGGMDLAGVFPKFINIRRGALLTALLSWVVQPWNFYNTSSTFISVMSSFGVVVTPIIAIIVADFHVIRRQKIPLRDLYTTASDGTFYFTRGFNFRAIITWLVTTIPGIPGIAASVQATKVPTGFNHFFYGSILFSFLCPFILYIGVCKLFPFKNPGVNDEYDHFNVFTLEECTLMNMAPYVEVEIIEGIKNNLKGEDSSVHEKNPYDIVSTKV